MNTFKRKSLYAALAAVSALGATTAAQAVNLNPDGLGQVLIYPYYTVQASNGQAYNSLLSVVNSTNSAKAVKVRILEGRNSREVLDFNLFLSPYDVWTSAILPSASGGGRIVTQDRSCTIPWNAGLQMAPAGTGTGVDFVNFAYTGTSADGGGTGLDRTREGYVELIEMATYEPTTITAQRVTHVNGLIPNNGCVNNNDADADADAGPATGGLFGGMTLINVGNGMDFTADAVALDNFWAPGDSQYTDAGSILPNLASGTSDTSVVFNGAGGVTTSVWPIGRTVDAVSAVLMHSAVMNEYVLEPATNSGTDWVVTMPTKRFYVNVGSGNAPRLFQRNFNNLAGSCDDVSLNIYDREERTTSAPVQFSPPPPTGTTAICWEATVITFDSSRAVLGSLNQTTLTPPQGFTNGWLRLGFPTPISGAAANVHSLINTGSTTVVSPEGDVTGPLSATYNGLPVVGFAAITFTNGMLNVGGTTVMSRYGGAFTHKYQPALQPLQLLAQ